MYRYFIALISSLFLALPAVAQQTSWVQIEAQRTLTGAQDAARGYAVAGVEDVTGFALPGGWYGIALGPYDASDAQTQLQRFRAAGLIPADSYIVDGGRFRTQFWPVGGAASAAPIEDTPPVTQEAPVAAAEPEVTLEPEVTQEPEQVDIAVIAAPDETISEAQASEQALDSDQKRQLQTAMQWAGVYDGAIDGLYGRGTRASMAAQHNARSSWPPTIQFWTEWGCNWCVMMPQGLRCKFPRGLSSSPDMNRLLRGLMPLVIYLCRSC